ncbi:MAG: hypothetical protein EBV32_00310 [Proteobacteria bacterium]|uniref:Uncharacterized protein n=1 Tax=Candidatus Fonsibacter lacus TaxID=2576439 RepID=A0A964XRS2_9PROT|nr:hypothetical protein [Candidatus Fonsibacter lacus]NCU72098.1 hypothetical protein [Candidatus Fonsibacter lacus]
MPIRRDSRGRFAGTGGGSGRAGKSVKLSSGQKAKANQARASYGVRSTGSGQSKPASSAAMANRQQQAKANGQQRAEALGSLKMASSNLRYRAAAAQRGLPKGAGLSVERSSTARALNKDRNTLNDMRRQLKPKRWKPAK